MFIPFLASNVPPPKVSLLSCFHGFFHTLLDSPSKEVQVLVLLSARDLRTNIGKNLHHIQEQKGLNPWEYGKKRIKRELLKYSYSEFPVAEMWRLPYLEKLLNQRSLAHYNGDIDLEQHLNELIQSLVSS